MCALCADAIRGEQKPIHVYINVYMYIYLNHIYNCGVAARCLAGWSHIRMGMKVMCAPDDGNDDVEDGGNQKHTNKAQSVCIYKGHETTTASSESDETYIVYMHT